MTALAFLGIAVAAARLAGMVRTLRKLTARQRATLAGVRA